MPAAEEAPDAAAEGPDAAAEGPGAAAEGPVNTGAESDATATAEGPVVAARAATRRCPPVRGWASGVSCSTCAPAARAVRDGAVCRARGGGACAAERRGRA